MIPKGVRYFIGYSAISIALLAWSIYDSLTTSYNFIMFLVEISDGIKLGISLNSIILAFMVVIKLLQFILFGSLRIIEVEHLFEKLPFFIIGSFLNLATGENDIVLNVLLMGLAIMFKFIHIVMFDRLDFLNLKMVNKLSGGDELVTISIVLKHFAGSINFWLNIICVFLDFYVAKFLVYDVFQGVNSVTCLLFGFQFAVQGVEALTNFAKLMLGIYEIIFYRIDRGRVSEEESATASVTEQTDDSAEEVSGEQEPLIDEDDEFERIWENKTYYSKTIDIGSSMLTAISYIGFMYLLIFESGLQLPLSMIQGTYSSIRQAYVQITQLRVYIESSKRLDSQLINATTEDLSGSDNLCIICREDMHSIEDYQRLFHKPQSSRRYAKKLQCGHILHLGCLKEWMERSDSCPLCRRKVFGNEPANTSAAEAQAPPQAPPPQPQPGAVPVAPAMPTATPPNQEIRTEELPLTPTPTTTSSAIGTASASTTTTATNENIDMISQEPLEGTSSLEGITPHQISLPSNALLPPDWVIIPLEKSDNSNYKVKLSKYHSADLKIKTKDHNREIIVYDIPQESTL
ncbi:ERAD-associated E3 ubiquitin-protein ligase HRD1 [Spathaspora sp. JA1]|nr:ERAD-associated E3 ubiquitin-protein ligase HRD1 [Spathaspora sp. JA1]